MANWVFSLKELFILSTIYILFHISTIWRMVYSEPSWPRYCLILLNLLLLVVGFTLFTCSTWLSNIPEHQLHLTLLSPLFTSINITLLTFAVFLLICAGVGLIAAIRVTRYYTAMVTMVTRYRVLQRNQLITRERLYFLNNNLYKFSYLVSKRKSIIINQYTSLNELDVPYCKNYKVYKKKIICNFSTFQQCNYNIATLQLCHFATLKHCIFATLQH